MKKDEFMRLRIGDVIMREPTGDTFEEWLNNSYVVTGNFGDKITAVRSVNIIKPDNWRLMAKSVFLHEEEDNENGNRDQE